MSQLTLGQAGERDIIVAGGSDGTLRVWDADNVIPSYKLTLHDRNVRALATGHIMDRDIIVSSSNHLVRIGDAATGEPLGAPLAGHTGDVTALAVGRIGRRDVVVSGSWDHTVRVWDMTRGESLVIDLLGGVPCLP